MMRCTLRGISPLGEEVGGGEFGEAADFAYLRAVRQLPERWCYPEHSSRPSWQKPRKYLSHPSRPGRAPPFCHGVVGCAERVGEGAANLLVELLLQGA